MHVARVTAAPTINANRGDLRNRTGADTGFQVRVYQLCSCRVDERGAPFIPMRARVHAHVPRFLMMRRTVSRRATREEVWHLMQAADDITRHPDRADAQPSRVPQNRSRHIATFCRSTRPWVNGTTSRCSISWKRGLHAFSLSRCAGWASRDALPGGIVFAPFPLWHLWTAVYETESSIEDLLTSTSCCRLKAINITPILKEPIRKEKIFVFLLSRLGYRVLFSPLCLYGSIAWLPTSYIRIYIETRIMEVRMRSEWSMCNSRFQNLN